MSKLLEIRDLTVRFPLPQCAQLGLFDAADRLRQWAGRSLAG